MEYAAGLCRCASCSGMLQHRHRRKQTNTSDCNHDGNLSSRCSHDDIQAKYNLSGSRVALSPFIDRSTDACTSLRQSSARGAAGTTVFESNSIEHLASCPLSTTTTHSNMHEPLCVSSIRLPTNVTKIAKGSLQVARARRCRPRWKKRPE